METLSKTYGWLPSDIKKQSLSDIKYYIRILSIRQQLEAKQNKKLNGNKRT